MSERVSDYKLGILSEKDELGVNVSHRSHVLQNEAP